MKLTKSELKQLIKEELNLTEKRQIVKALENFDNAWANLIKAMGGENDANAMIRLSFAKKVYPFKKPLSEQYKDVNNWIRKMMVSLDAFTLE